MQKKLMILAILAVVALGIIDLTYDPGVKADVECPMANRNIEWHYFGK
jgi:hypothetical protein